MISLQAIYPEAEKILCSLTEVIFSIKIQLICLESISVQVRLDQS